MVPLTGGTCFVLALVLPAMLLMSKLGMLGSCRLSLPVALVLLAKSRGDCDVNCSSEDLKKKNNNHTYTSMHTYIYTQATHTHITQNKYKCQITMKTTNIILAPNLLRHSFYYNIIYISNFCCWENSH